MSERPMPESVEWFASALDYRAGIREDEEQVGPPIEIPAESQGRGHA